MLPTTVPGVIIHHVPAATRQYVGCPSIVILPNGRYVASHSYFGPGATNDETFVYESADLGASWKPIARIRGQIWSSLFMHRDALYIMGTDHCDRYGSWVPRVGATFGERLNGRMVIRRSDDGGRSWTTPDSAATGLLSDYDGYHTAPMPVVSHAGRLWRTMEFAPHAERLFWRTFMLSIGEDADLLDRASWVQSEMIEHPWSHSQWIEGNALVDRDGSVVNLLRTNFRGGLSEHAVAHVDRAALVHVSGDGLRLVHHPDYDIITMPGGGTKFTVRLDSVSDRYWALVNKQLDPPSRRNRLSLVSSPDLRRWTTERLLLSHPDPDHHAFQYVDWVFDGEDIIAVSRTAYDDGEGGAHNYHDANYLTFHRIDAFRTRTELYPARELS
ncbi:MAG: exo-alpha-sialidase [Spirochaetaceae bacterium]|nr:MAG: exo-alpha-sialidase [Spirochaetaceae bacterium]